MRRVRGLFIYLTRTMQDRDCPSQDTVTVVMPLLTPVTVPSPPTVAMPLSLTCQVSVEVTPLRVSFQLSPTARVMSSRFSLLAPPEPLEPPELPVEAGALPPVIRYRHDLQLYRAGTVAGEQVYRQM